MNCYRSTSRHLTTCPALRQVEQAVKAYKGGQVRYTDGMLRLDSQLMQQLFGPTLDKITAVSFQIGMTYFVVVKEFYQVPAFFYLPPSFCQYSAACSIMGS